MQYTTADLIQLGDIIQCICAQGCLNPTKCQNYCPKNTCNPPQGTWEKVLNIKYQPALQDNWVYFTLTNSKQFGAWGKQLIIKQD